MPTTVEWFVPQGLDRAQMLVRKEIEELRASIEERERALQAKLTSVRDDLQLELGAIIETLELEDFFSEDVLINLEPHVRELPYVQAAAQKRFYEIFKELGNFYPKYGYESPLAAPTIEVLPDVNHRELMRTLEPLERLHRAMLPLDETSRIVVTNRDSSDFVNVSFDRDSGLWRMAQYIAIYPTLLLAVIDAANSCLPEEEDHYEF